LCSSPYIIKAIKSRQAKLEGGGEEAHGMRGADEKCKVLVGNPETRRPLGRLDVDRIILKCIANRVIGELLRKKLKNFWVSCKTLKTS
jgi:hypothetical protein